MDHVREGFNPLGDKQSEYEAFMNGCVEYYAPDGHLCWDCEKDRIQRSFVQPQSMVNYTQNVRCWNIFIFTATSVWMFVLKDFEQSFFPFIEKGFLKIRAPEQVYAVIKEFWDNNRDRNTSEYWPAG